MTWTRARRRLIEHSVSFAVALALLLVVRSSLLDIFKIPTGSMIPTLLVGDRVLVNKMAYGLKWPFASLFGQVPQAWVREAPRRGDVIAFRYPKDESIHYLKRVIGTPGDWIRIRGRVLTVNDRVVALEADPMAGELFERIDDPLIAPDEFEFKRETIDGRAHRVLHDRNSFVGEAYGPIAVPPEHLFVLGDNRDFSNDSRFWGFVPLKNVEGRAIRVAFSFSWALSPFDAEVRPGRTWQAVE